MTRHEALDILELWLDPMKPGSSVDVRQNYARLVKADHPDHGGPGTNAKRLKEARDILLYAVSPKCPICNGTGRARRPGKLITFDCPMGCDRD